MTIHRDVFEFGTWRVFHEFWKETSQHRLLAINQAYRYEFRLKHTLVSQWFHNLAVASLICYQGQSEGNTPIFIASRRAVCCLNHYGYPQDDKPDFDIYAGKRIQHNLLMQE